MFLVQCTFCGNQSSDVNTHYAAYMYHDGAYSASVHGESEQFTLLMQLPGLGTKYAVFTTIFRCQTKDVLLEIKRPSPTGDLPFSNIQQHSRGNIASVSCQYGY